jgi:hypothetical protein
MANSPNLLHFLPIGTALSKWTTENPLQPGQIEIFSKKTNRNVLGIEMILRDGR